MEDYLGFVSFGLNKIQTQGLQGFIVFQCDDLANSLDIKEIIIQKLKLTKLKFIDTKDFYFYKSTIISFKDSNRNIDYLLLTKYSYNGWATGRASYVGNAFIFSISDIKWKKEFIETIIKRLNEAEKITKFNTENLQSNWKTLEYEDIKNEVDTSYKSKVNYFFKGEANLIYSTDLPSISQIFYENIFNYRIKDITLTLNETSANYIKYHLFEDNEYILNSRYIYNNSDLKQEEKTKITEGKENNNLSKKNNYVLENFPVQSQSIAPVKKVVETNGKPNNFKETPKNTKYNTNYFYWLIPVFILLFSMFFLFEEENIKKTEEDIVKKDTVTFNDNKIVKKEDEKIEQDFQIFLKEKIDNPKMLIAQGAIHDYFLANQDVLKDNENLINMYFKYLEKYVQLIKQKRINFDANTILNYVQVTKNIDTANSLKTRTNLMKLFINNKNSEGLCNLQKDISELNYLNTHHDSDLTPINKNKIQSIIEGKKVKIANIYTMVDKNHTYKIKTGDKLDCLVYSFYEKYKKKLNGITIDNYKIAMKNHNIMTDDVIIKENELKILINMENL